MGRRQGERNSDMAIRFNNLKTEQARKGYTNDQVAQILGMSRGNYEAKLRNGRFYAKEALMLCKLYECDFLYLFAEEEEDQKEAG